MANLVHTKMWVVRTAKDRCRWLLVPGLNQSGMKGGCSVEPKRTSEKGKNGSHTTVMQIVVIERESQSHVPKVAVSNRFPWAWLLPGRRYKSKIYAFVTLSACRYSKVKLLGEQLLAQLSSTLVSFRMKLWVLSELSVVSQVKSLRNCGVRILLCPWRRCRTAILISLLRSLKLSREGLS